MIQVTHIKLNAVSQREREHTLDKEAALLPHSHLCSCCQFGCPGKVSNCSSLHSAW